MSYGICNGMAHAYSFPGQASFAALAAYFRSLEDRREESVAGSRMASALFRECARTGAFNGRLDVVGRADQRGREDELVGGLLLDHPTKVYWPMREFPDLHAIYYRNSPCFAFASLIHAYFPPVRYSTCIRGRRVIPS